MSSPFTPALGAACFLAATSSFLIFAVAAYPKHGGNDVSCQLVTSGGVCRGTPGNDDIRDINGGVVVRADSGNDMVFANAGMSLPDDFEGQGGQDYLEAPAHSSACPSR